MFYVAAVHRTTNQLVRTQFGFETLEQADEYLKDAYPSDEWGWVIVDRQKAR